MAKKLKRRYAAIRTMKCKRTKSFVDLGRKEHVVLYRHGFCYVCNGRFLSGNGSGSCLTCAELRKQFRKRYGDLPMTVNKLGPTKLSNCLMDTALSEGDLSAWLSRERKFDCRWYGECLNYAGKLRWTSFTCRWCEISLSAEVVQKEELPATSREDAGSSLAFRSRKLEMLLRRVEKVDLSKWGKANVELDFES